jgi:DNA-binding transcriptional MocR family regulator
MSPSRRPGNPLASRLDAALLRCEGFWVRARAGAMPALVVGQDVVDQVALARLLESGDYERHVSRYRSQQRALRDGLVCAMGESSLSGIAHAEERDSGLHFVLALPAGDGGPDAERAVARAALERGPVGR